MMILAVILFGCGKISSLQKPILKCGGGLYFAVLFKHFGEKNGFVWSISLKDVRETYSKRSRTAAQ